MQEKRTLEKCIRSHDQIHNPLSSICFDAKKKKKKCHRIQRSMPFHLMSSTLMTVSNIYSFAFIQDEREQRLQASQLVHEFNGRISKKDENAWRRAREEILWLRNWGASLQPNEPGVGVFGRIKTEFLEAEFLKALLSNGRTLSSAK